MKKTALLFFYFSISFSYPQQSSLSESVNSISEYIASEYFYSLLDSTDHIRLIDSIYLNALAYNKNNISETLLSLTFATVPYRRIPITIPLLNLKLYYPLISADREIFELKNNNLPSRIFFDSPENSYGDKDKIAHFFGNAFIGYHSTILNPGNLLGIFVEVFEESFKIQSSIDERDLNTNFYGRAFGKALKENKFVLPSQSLILYPTFYTIFRL